MPERWYPWKDAAHDLKAFLDIDVKTASSEVRLKTEIEGIEVEAIGRSTPYREGTDTTVIRAEAPGSAGMRLRITTGQTPRLARLLGEREVDIGVPAFDARFHVLASDLGFAKSWLGVDVRSEIVAAPQYEYALRRSSAIAERECLEDDYRRLVAAVRAVAQLARQARRIEREWSRCAAEVGGVLGDDPADKHTGHLPEYAVRHGGAEIQVARFFGRVGRSRRKQLFTRATCGRTTHTPDTYVIYLAEHGRHLRTRVPGASETLSIDDPDLTMYAVDCESPERMEQRLDSAARAHIAKVAPALITAGRSAVMVYLWGVVRNDERVLSAVTLAQRLAIEIDSGAVGPYR
jgi:hypothetical protein